MPWAREEALVGGQNHTVHRNPTELIHAHLCPSTHHQPRRVTQSVFKPPEDATWQNQVERWRPLMLKFRPTPHFDRFKFAPLAQSCMFWGVRVGIRTALRVLRLGFVLSTVISSGNSPRRILHLFVLNLQPPSLYPLPTWSKTAWSMDRITQRMP